MTSTGRARVHAKTRVVVAAAVLALSRTAAAAAAASGGGPQCAGVAARAAGHGGGCLPGVALLQLAGSLGKPPAAEGQEGVAGAMAKATAAVTATATAAPSPPLAGHGGAPPLDADALPNDTARAPPPVASSGAGASTAESAEEAPPPTFAAALRRAADALGMAPSRLDGAIRGKRGAAEENATAPIANTTETVDELGAEGVAPTMMPAAPMANTTETDGEHGAQDAAPLDRRLLRHVERHGFVGRAGAAEGDDLVGQSERNSTASDALSNGPHIVVTLPVEGADSAADGQGNVWGTAANASAGGADNASVARSGNSSSESESGADNRSNVVGTGRNGSTRQLEPMNSSTFSDASLGNATSDFDNSSAVVPSNSTSAGAPDSAASGIDGSSVIVPSNSTSAVIAGHLGPDALPNGSNTSVVGMRGAGTNTSNGTPDGDTDGVAAAAEAPAPEEEERPWWWFMSPYWWKHSSAGAA